MKIVQGFGAIEQYVNNTIGVIAPFGELSTHSSTYTKEKGEYRSINVPGYKLITFKVINSATGEQTTVENTLVEEILTVVRSVVGYATTHIRPYDSEDFQNTVRAEYPLTLSGFEIGPMEDGPTVSLPEFLTWTSLNHDSSQVRIWLSDTAFADQYSGYDITVIPPVNNLNDLFLPYIDALDVIAQQSMSELGDKIQEAKNRHPETVVRLMDFDFVNRYDSTRFSNTTWGILVYGKEGDYIDAIKDAVASYILANSNFNAEQWRDIFPEIFEQTEMIVVPRWDKLAVENLTEHSSLYSSVFEISSALPFVESLVPFYDQLHISQNTYALAYPYKTLMLNIVNGVDNALGKQDFLAMYPDYLPIPSTSLDFARMQLKTQEFVLFMDDMLIEAEKVTPISGLPSGMRRVVRDNILFVASTLDEVNYLVAAKFNPQYQ